MASWAALVKTTVAPAAAAPTAEAPPVIEGGAIPIVAVVDANALIAGQRLETLGAQRFVTIPEVLGEVRDAHSRAYMASLPFTLEAQEPSEEALRTVLRFARETGDIQALSAADLKLLALAYTLEVAAHGSSHLREHPVQPRVRSKHRKSTRRLQGWGYVPNPEDWKVVDEMEDEDDAPQASSRIIGAVQALDSGAKDAGPPPQQPPSSSTAAAAPPAAVGASADTSSLESAAAGLRLESSPAAAPDAAAGVSGELAGLGAAPAAASVAGGEEEEEDSEGDEDAGGWQDGGKTRGAARKQRRKQMRHKAWVAAHQEQQAAAPAAAPAPVAAPLAQQSAAATPAGAAAAAPAAAASAAAGNKAEASGSRPAEEEQGGEETSSSGSDSEDDGEDSQGSGSSSGSGSESGEDGDETTEDGRTASTSAAGGADGSSVTTGTMGPGSTLGGLGDTGEVLPNTTSSVLSVTADFAMQNVLLQMGLRLVTRDGMQITRLSVWSLRCTACSSVTKEVGRLFCPKCGNMTMEKVEVTVGPEGAEYYGVRKKHCLRGTRYSLPKPKGGRQNGPILCEDVMMQRMGKKIRRMQRLQKQQEAGIAAGTVDAFAPEFGPDTWFKAQHTASDKGAAALLAGWKHNPNERKGARTNRRK